MTYRPTDDRRLRPRHPLSLEDRSPSRWPAKRRESRVDHDGIVERRTTAVELIGPPRESEDDRGAYGWQLGDTSFEPRHPYQSRYDYDADRDRFSLVPEAVPQPRAQRGRGPKGYVRPDARIFEDVCDRIGWELDASDVEVSVVDGEVTLRGTVADRATKRAMEELADGVFGVKDVHNRLTLRTDTH